MFGDFRGTTAASTRSRALSDLPALIRHTAESALGREHPDVPLSRRLGPSLPAGSYFQTPLTTWLTVQRQGCRLTPSCRRWASGRSSRPRPNVTA